MAARSITGPIRLLVQKYLFVPLKLARFRGGAPKLKIDVTITASRRPELLSLTICSLLQQWPSDLEIRTVFVNIDPVGGTAEDDERIERLLRKTFPDVQVFFPREANHASAVQRLWLLPGTRWFLHLEDDWLFTERLPSGRWLDKVLKGRTAQVVLWNRHKFQGHRFARYDYNPFTGFPDFSTSPSFLLTEFASTCAQLLDTSKNPEKQLDSPDVPKLYQHTEQFRARISRGPWGRFAIEDLGRVWRTPASQA